METRILWDWWMDLTKKGDWPKSASCRIFEHDVCLPEMWCNMTFQKRRPSTWLTCENLNLGDKNDVDVPIKNNYQRKTGWSNSMLNPFKKSVVNGKSSVYGSLILPGCSIHQMDPETTCDHSAIHNGFEDLGIESGHPAFGNAEQSSSNNRFLWCRDVWRMRKLQWQRHEFKQRFGPFCARADMLTFYSYLQPRVVIWHFPNFFGIASNLRHSGLPVESHGLQQCF